MAIIKEAWKIDISGSPSFIWESKLRRIRSVLKAWVKLEYTSVSSKKIQLQTELSSLHSRMEREEITTFLISQEKDIEFKDSQSSHRRGRGIEGEV